MTEITLIRHGQAQSGATDEASYDQLSDLGFQQAGWLGEHLRPYHQYERLLSGTMRRQIQTAQSLALDNIPHDQDARLNELDYFGLANSLKESHGTEIPTDLASFTAHFPQLLEVWQKGDVHSDLESYEEFRGRIMAALRDVAEGQQPAVLVTSTGVISTLVSMALGLDFSQKCQIFLSIMHTSVHKFSMGKDGLRLVQFGATPHLDVQGRLHAKTHV